MKREVEILGTEIEEAVEGRSTQDGVSTAQSGRTARTLPGDKAHCKQIIFTGLISSVAFNQLG